MSGRAVGCGLGSGSQDWKYQCVAIKMPVFDKCQWLLGALGGRRQWTQDKDVGLSTGTGVTSLAHSGAVTCAAAWLSAVACQPRVPGDSFCPPQVPEGSSHTGSRRSPDR